jgi:hypothetical protein
MTGIELLALGGKAAGKTAFGRIFSETLTGLKHAAGSLFTKQQIERSVNKFYTKIGRVRLVKTLWQVDKPVDIGTFYCESHVYIGEERKKVISLADFGSISNVVIEGIAGQGKSIFLRYLCSVELVRSEFIPVFLELRRLRKDLSLHDHIQSTLAEFGLKVNREQLEGLLSSGRILVLLDGFDEVDDDDKSWLIGEIEHLAKCYDSTRIIVSSRPQSGIEVSPVFHVIKLSDLMADEYQAVIYRLLDDKIIAADLIKRVQSHGGQVKELLKTPLLVTLLVVIYKASQEIPAQLSDFYESLFKLLLQRHDGTKPGYRRRRLCTINDSDYRRAFEALCYFAKKHKQGLWKHELISATAEEALKAVDIEEDSESFLNDIIKITCLIVKDGEEYRFIHKSVQEYYAACYIKNKPDIVSRKIYERMFSSPASYKWNHELQFLGEIDTYRFFKYGLLPAICSYLGVSEKELVNSTAEQLSAKVVNQIRSGLVILLKYVSRTKHQNAYVNPVFIIPDIQTLFLENVSPLDGIDYSVIFEAANIGKIQSTGLDYFNPDIEKGFQVQFGDVFDSKLLDVELSAAILQIASNLASVGKNCLARITKEEEDQISLTALLE